MRRFLLSILLCCLAHGALAHKLAPSLLAIRQAGETTWDVTWKTPRFAPTPVPIEPQLPAGCNDVGERRWQYEGTGVRIDWTMRCSGPLAGGVLRVSGLAENQSAALIRIEPDDGSVLQGMLNGSSPEYRIAVQPSRLDVWRTYTVLGIEHILGGIDHLLFVLGLLLLVPGRRELVLTITAFTVGHSVTLALAALGFLRYPVDLVEFLIAFSIFVVAVELTRESDGSHWLRRRPWLAAVSFGLLHGMGFAGALLDVGLPANEIPLALLSFNVGIEIGQLLFVAAALLAGLLARRAWTRGALPGWSLLRWAPVYVIGTASAYWCIERGGAVLFG